MVKVITRPRSGPPVFMNPPTPPDAPDSGETDREALYGYQKDLEAYDSMMRLYRMQCSAIDKFLFEAHQMHPFESNNARAMHQCDRCWGWYDDFRHIGRV